MLSKKYEKALREAYKAFFDLPWKSTLMFDTMDDLAEVIFNGEMQSDEVGQRLVNKFLKAFENNARTDEQKKAIENLMFIDLL